MSLNMVKRIVAAHSGSIEVRSEKQKGLSIYINLPIIQKIFG
jgi:signal transduction histidine kinase